MYHRLQQPVTTTKTEQLKIQLAGDFSMKHSISKNLLFCEQSNIFANYLPFFKKTIIFLVILELISIKIADLNLNISTEIKIDNRNQNLPKVRIVFKRFYKSHCEIIDVDTKINFLLLF